MKNNFAISLLFLLIIGCSAKSQNDLTFDHDHSSVSCNKQINIPSEVHGSIDSIQLSINWPVDCKAYELLIPSSYDEIEEWLRRRVVKNRTTIRNNTILHFRACKHGYLFWTKF